MRELFELDLSKLNLRSAVTGTIALAVVLVFLGVFGDVALAAGLAAVFVIVAGPSDTRRPDLSSLLLVLGGAAITFVVSVASASASAATIALTVITLGASLLALVGKRYRTMGVFGLLWSVLVLGFAATSEGATELAIAFAIGGGVALVAMWISSLLPDRATAADSPADPPESGPGDTQTTAPTPSAVIIRFSVVRALAVGLSVYLGYQLFPDHAAWVALTFVLVVRPPAHQTVVAGVARAIGTGLGVLLGIGITQLVTDSFAMQVTAFVVCAFLMMATNKVNPVLSTLFITTVLLMTQDFLQQQVALAGWQRLLATLLGVLLGFVAIGIVIGIGRRKEAINQSTSSVDES